MSRQSAGYPISKRMYIIYICVKSLISKFDKGIELGETKI